MNSHLIIFLIAIIWAVVKAVQDVINGSRAARATRPAPPPPVVFGAPPANAPGQWQPAAPPPAASGQWQPPASVPGQWQPPQTMPPAQWQPPQGGAPMGGPPGARPISPQPAASPDPRQQPSPYAPAVRGKKISPQQRYPVAETGSQSPLTGYSSNETFADKERILAAEQSIDNSSIEPAGAKTTAPELGKVLADRNSLLSAVVLHEIIGAPRSRRVSRLPRRKYISETEKKEVF